jgi:hypothetical protein
MTWGLSGCDKKDPMTTAEVNAKILEGTTTSTWNISSVTVDDTDQTSLFPGMKISFFTSCGCNDFTYTVVNGLPVWPLTGKWNFSDDGKLIKRDDGVEVTIDEISDNKLVLSFGWTKNTYGGRVNSIKGHHVFTLTR